VNIPYVQRSITNFTTNELSNRLGVPVQIEHVGIEWFNRLVLDGVYLVDEEGELLFKANHIAAGFEILPFLHGKFVFTTVRLFGFNVNLKKKTPDAPLNLQFIIDAFSSTDSLKKSPNVDLRFNSILIRRGDFSYHVASESSTPGKFNPHHVDINDLSANISLKAFNKDSLNANIKKMSLHEASGFSLEKLSMNIVGNRDSAFIDNFQIKLPQTNLNIDRATIALADTDSLTELLNNAPVDLRIAPSQVCLRDLSPFVPAFTNFRDTIEISAEATGYINNIDLKHLTLQYSDKMFLSGKMEMRGITNPEETYVFGQINQMYITNEGLSGMVNNFSEQPITLPDPIHRLGTLRFTGEISGFFDNLVAFGQFSSDIGSINTDVIFGKNHDKNIGTYVRGHVSTKGLRIDRLFPEGNPYGNVQFSINLDASRPINGKFTGNIHAQIDEIELKKYLYENIQLSGNFKENAFDGKVEVSDPNGELYAEGMFLHQDEHSIFNFTANVQHFKPDSLNLTDQFESPEISFSLNADFTGNTIDNIEGSVRIDSLSFQTTPSGFFLNKLEISANGYSDNRHLTIQSDIINGEVSGAYSFTTIVPSIMDTMKEYLPAFINSTQKPGPVKENNFSVLLTIENTEALSQTLKLPIALVSQGRITGHYNNRYNKFRLEAWLPKFKTGNSIFESGYLSCENPDDRTVLQLRAINYNNKGLRNYLDLKSDAKENRINTQIGWANNKDRLFKADLIASTFFAEETTDEGKTFLRTEISIDESPFVINDTTWTIQPSGITIQEGKIDINNFEISRENQFLQMNGIISQDPLDTLHLNLNKIELTYIFDMLNKPVLQFGGEATGTINANDIYNSRMLNTDLEVQNFSYSDVNLGRLNLYSEWDDIQRGILMLGTIYKNDSTWTDVNGYIFPVQPNEGLSLHFDANDIDISFLRIFLQDVTKDLQGHGFGHVHLHGPFKELNVEGDVFVENASFGIEFLDTYYTFSDSVHLDKTSVNLKDVTIYDKYGNTSKASVKFNHKHFYDYNFHASIQANKMLMYDKSEKDNPLIYGTVFGSGTATIQGNENIIDFDINMRSEPKTSVNLNFMTNSASEEYDFITFVDKSKLLTSTDSIKPDSLNRVRFANDEGAEYRMNFLLDITPDANIELIMDPTAGDKIKGNATGSLQVQYGTKSDLRMYGGLNIVDGKYNFSMQQIIHKDFKIRDGSIINFQGDPYNANMNVNAIYSLTANLGDLDQGLLVETSRASIPVNCVLNIEGSLRNPNISFDIELPGSTDELERRVKSFIDTDDMMTRQVVYLLVLNKFYTPDYSTGYRSNEFNAVASSAISSQLSSILDSFTDKVQIGTNIRAAQDGFTDDTEVEMLLSSQLLDNRLLFNGNFGYKNPAGSPDATQKNVFVGEFDLEYLLTPSGEIRLKAYNHANDMYQYLKQSLTTQGVGIMFKKDFTKFSDIFRRRSRRPLVLPQGSRPDTEPGTVIENN